MSENEIDTAQRDAIGMLMVAKLQKELQAILSDANTDEPRLKLRKVAIISYKLGDLTED